MTPKIAGGVGGVLKKVPGPAVMLAAMLVLQTSIGAASTLTHIVGPGGVALLRVGMSGVVLALVTRPKVRARRGPKNRVCCLLGVVVAVNNLAVFEALQRLPQGVVITIAFLGPLMVVLTGSGLGLGTTWALLAGLGVLVVSGVGSRSLAHVNITGLGFAFLSAAGWGAMILLLASMGDGSSGYGDLALALIIGGVLLLPIGVAEGGTRLLRPDVLARGMAVGVASGAVAYSLELTALRRVPTQIYGVLASLEPAVAVVVGLVILCQQLDTRELVGIALVMRASVAAATRSAPRPLPSEDADVTALTTEREACPQAQGADDRE
jgi:inner membrane transporter RhtA